MTRMYSTETHTYWHDGKNVWRGSNGETVFDVHGNPMGLRWECSIPHFIHYAKLQVMGEEGFHWAVNYKEEGR